jgi:predicted phosphodiesterase
MRIAIISDIHSNIEALTRAFEIINENKIDTIMCTGDIVGYGANPNECVDLIRQRAHHVLRGNHDDAAVTLARIENYTYLAQTVVAWTNKILSDQNREFLQTLPFTAELEDLFFTHASPFEPEEWHYIITEYDARINFDYFTGKICFIGHTHRPIIFSTDGITKDIMREQRYIVNVGSIGQPRDSDRRLSFGVFDTLTWTYENIRADYDFRSAAQKIIDAGLPHALAERLSIGR